MPGKQKNRKHSLPPQASAQRQRSASKKLHVATLNLWVNRTIKSFMHPLIALFLFASLAVAQAPTRFVIKDVRVFDGVHMLEHRTVFVEGGRIVRVSRAGVRVENAEVIDGRGRTLMPGLIDSHVHIGNEDALRQSVVLGVTTVLDMFTTPDRLIMLKRVEAEDPPDMADVRTAGIGATAPGGHPTEMGGPPSPTLASAADAAQFVDQRIAEGSDFIKVIYDDLAAIGKPVPTLDLKTISAVIDAAHRRGKLVVVHVMGERQAREVIAAHADGLAHMFIGKTASSDFGRYVAQHHASVIPTLVTLYNVCGIGIGKKLAADPHLCPTSSPISRPRWPSPGRGILRFAMEPMTACTSLSLNTCRSWPEPMQPSPARHMARLCMEN